MTFGTHCVKCGNAFTFLGARHHKFTIECPDCSNPTKGVSPVITRRLLFAVNALAVPATKENRSTIVDGIRALQSTDDFGDKLYNEWVWKAMLELERRLDTIKDD